jgi:hypothetical protein
MGLFLRILIGAVIAAAGTFFVLKTEVILGFFGTVDWAERKLGGGGSRLFYKLIGIGLCFIGFMVMTNLWGNFLEWTLGSFLPKPEPGL